MMLMTSTRTIADGADIPSNLIKEAMIMVSRAMADPGERSIPPVRMTSVDPTATMATMLACSATLLRLSSSMNRSVERPTAIDTATREIIGPITGTRDRKGNLGLMMPALGRMAGTRCQFEQPVLGHLACRQDLQDAFVADDGDLLSLAASLR